MSEAREYCIVQIEFQENGERYPYLAQIDFSIGDLVELSTINTNTNSHLTGWIVEQNFYSKGSLPYNIQELGRVRGVIPGYNKYGIEDNNSYDVKEKIRAISNIKGKFLAYLKEKLGEEDSFYQRVHDEEYITGDCLALWYYQKMFYKEKYNIDWLTPAECNPNIRFD